MPAGRPKVNNTEILDGIKKNPEQLKYLASTAEEVEKLLLIIAGAQDAIKSRVADASEELGLSKGFISKGIKSRFEGKGDILLADAEAQHELIELLDKSPSPQAADDEEF